MIDRVRLFAWGGGVPAEIGSARGTFGERRGLLLAVESGGVLGLGEASPLPGFSLETIDACAEALASMNWRLVELPVDPTRLEEAWACASGRADVPAARFAFETAVASIAATARGISLSTWLSGRTADRIPRSVYVGATSDPETVRRAREAHARGVRTIKLKRPKEALDATLASLQSVREAVGDDVAVRLDFNGTLDPSEAPDLVEALARFDLELIEEPCSGLALCALGPLAVPWFADESLVDAALREALLASEAMSGVVLKPTLVGGLASVWSLARQAIERGKGVIVTHAFEGPVALAAAAELALAIAASLDRSFAPGLDAHAALPAFASWLVPQLPSRGGDDGAFVVPSAGLGLGVSLDASSLEGLEELFRWMR